MAAKVLTEAGADTVLLEAGPNWDVTKDGAMLKWNYESPRRGAGYRGRPFGEFDGEPRRLGPGGRALHHWPGHALHVVARAACSAAAPTTGDASRLRFGPYDFKARSRDGLGDDWPISYDDLKPYYDKLDQFVGIFGSDENLPNEPDGIFMPPPAPRAYERLVKKTCDELEITCIPSRLSILTKPLNGRPGLPLLRPVRARLLDPLELLEPVGPAAPGPQDGPAHPRHRRHGPRGHDRRRRASRPACPTSTPRPGARRRSGPGSSCSRPAPASRPASS